MGAGKRTRMRPSPLTRKPINTMVQVCFQHAMSPLKRGERAER